MDLDAASTSFSINLLLQMLGDLGFASDESDDPWEA
jgi:hypothetical protein